MVNNLIELVQEPIIREQLLSIKAEIEDKVDKALSVPCTEESCTEVKKIRAELNKDFEDLETRRKELKKKILEPYEKFNELYEECVPNVYKPALKTLSDRVNAIDDVVKEEKRAKLVKYFDELCESNNIDFVSFEDTKINITKSASDKALKEQAKAFVDRVSSDIETINTLDDCDEVMVEYKALNGSIRCFLDAAESIKTVSLRHKALKEQAQAKVEAIAEEQSQKEREDIVNAVLAENEEFSAPVEVEVVETPNDERKTTSFTVRASLKMLKELKEFLINGGYEIL